MALRLHRSSRFKGDTIRAKRRGENMAILRSAILLLVDGQPLPDTYHDSALDQLGSGVRILTLGHDWLLLYRVTNTELQLIRTGPESELFD